MICWLVWLAGQELAQLQDRLGKRDDARSRLPLLCDRLVVGEDPEGAIQINPLSNQLAHLCWSATGQAERDLYSPEVDVCSPKKRLELFRRDDSRAPSRPRFLVAGQILVCQHRKGGVEPIAPARQFALPLRNQGFELPAGNSVVPMQFLSLAAEGSTPPPARPVKPRLLRVLSSHFRVSRGLDETATENPLRPARGTELSVPLSVPRVGLRPKSRLIVAVNRYNTRT